MITVYSRTYIEYNNSNTRGRPAPFEFDENKHKNFVPDERKQRFLHFARFNKKGKTTTANNKLKGFLPQYC